VDAAAQAAEEVDGLASGEAGPEGDVAGDVGEPLVQLGGVLPGVGAEEFGPALVGAEHAEEDADGGGLPGAVRAEEAVRLPLRHFEVQMVERGHVTEALDQVLSADHCVHAPKLSQISGICKIYDGFGYHMGHLLPKRGNDGRAH
jgi:hypothetical protein